MDKQGEKLATTALIIGAAYLFVIRPIGNFLDGNDADKQAVTDLQSSPDSQNPFSPNFGIAYSAETGINTDYTTQSFAFIKNGYADPANLGTDGIHSALPYMYWAEKIYRSMDWFAVDLPTVQSAFSAMTCQYEVSQMAQWLLYTYNVDLLTWLIKGQALFPFLDNGIGTSNLAAIITHVQTLPVFDSGQMIL